MKSPFVILLAIVVLVGICIGVATIILIGPTNQDDDADTISIASERDLPTPSTRNEAVQTQVGTTERQPAVVVVSTSVTTEESSSDELAPEIQERIESGEAVVVITAEASGRGGFRGGGPGPGFGGGDDNPNVQAIQEAIQSNPEIQELFQKVQTGNISQADQERLRELILAEAGIEASGAGQGGGFGTPPIQGIISTIDGYTLTIDHADDSGLSTDVQVTDNTNITVINELTAADLTVDANVAGTVQRGEGGRIFIVNLTILPEQQEQGFGGGFGGGFRGLFGGAFGAGGDATSLSNINGTISEINDQTISVETTQGTLRLTADDESTIVSTSSGTVGDIMEGMAVIAFGGSQDNTPIQPRNLIVGPDAMLQVNQDQ